MRNLQSAAFCEFVSHLGARILLLVKETDLTGKGLAQSRTEGKGGDLNSLLEELGVVTGLAACDTLAR